MEDEDTQDKMRQVRLGGKPKNWSISFMNDHSSLLKAFFKVNLEDHIGILNFHSSKISYILLDDDGMIKEPPVSQEASLSGAYDGLEKGLDSINNDLCYKLVTGVAQANRSVISQARGISTLWNEAEESIVIVSQNGARREDFSIEGDSFWTNISPNFLKEEMVEAVRSRGF